VAGFQRVEDIQAWVVAIDLVADLHARFDEGRVKGSYWIRDQVLRAALSISNKIADGFGRGSDAEFARFLSYSRGSAMEVISCLHVLVRIGLFTAEEAAPLHQLATLCLQQVSRLQGYLTPGRVREDNLEAYHAL